MVWLVFSSQIANYFCVFVPVIEIAVYAHHITGGCRLIPLPSICSPVTLSIAANRFNLLSAIKAPKITAPNGLPHS